MASDLLQGMCIESRLVCMNLEAETDQQALDILGGHLLKEGIVKESYLPAVKEREVNFSTGLQFEEMGIAIPHTDAEHVNVAAIGIGVLKKPVEFKFMGMPEVPVETEMIFMMAIKEAHSQVEFLQALMDVFSTEGRLEALKACDTEEKLIETFKSFF